VPLSSILPCLQLLDSMSDLCSTILDRLAAAWRSNEAQKFLEELEATQRSLKILAADRSYRQDFSANYQPLFRDSERCYRPEIYEACTNQAIGDDELWVNGTLHQISSSTIERARSLESFLKSLSPILQTHSSSPVVIREVKLILGGLDVAWAEFEKSYIFELIEIENQARKPMVTAVALDRELRAMERMDKPKDRDGGSSEKPARLCQFSGTESPRQRQLSGADSPCSRQRQLSGEMPPISAASQSLNSMTSSHKRSSDSDLHQLASSAAASLASGRRKVLENLVAQVASLNSVANVTGRGRKDLTIDVLEAAATTFLSERGSTPASAAARILASRILVDFANLRNYFEEMADCMIRVDPQLSNNSDLVQRLAAWEDSWELGARFLLQPNVLDALCDVAAKTAVAQNHVPDLKCFLDDQDAELFLILPRLVVLFGMERESGLLASFLPHHFGESKPGQLSEGHIPEPANLPGCVDEGNLDSRPRTSNPALITSYPHLSPEMSKLVGEFQMICKTRTLPLARQMMIERAVAGSGDGATSQDVDDFMLRLESFSMEVQRHRPEDWNRCSLILLQCIEAATTAVEASAEGTIFLYQ